MLLLFLPLDEVEEGIEHLKAVMPQNPPEVEALITSGVGRCQKVCVWGGGGGGAHRHVMYVPSVKNQYKRVVYGYLITAICVSLLKLSTR